MKKWRGRFVTVVLLSLLAAFSRSSDAGPELSAEQSFMSRTEVQKSNGYFAVGGAAAPMLRLHLW